jgi:catechol 2,3-dioxygenase-like lactoylglutathione lyase family enzyme
MTVMRMDNVGIVVEDLDAAVEFFVELGLVLEGRMPIEGEWAGRASTPRPSRFAVEDIDDTLARLSRLRRHLPALLHPGAGRNSDRARPTARAAGLPGESHGTRALRGS